MFSILEDKDESVIEGLILELRRGTIILSVLSQLKTPQYGYSLVVILKDKGVEVDPGTLYPLLRRLEKQKLLTSKWDTESSKPRKYYQISEYGNRIYEKLCEHWRVLSQTIENLISDEEEG